MEIMKSYYHLIFINGNYYLLLTCDYWQQSLVYGKIERNL